MTWDSACSIRATHPPTETERDIIKSPSKGGVSREGNLCNFVHALFNGDVVNLP